MTTRTPQGTEELTLLMAGLGKRVIMVPENSNHSEVIPVEVLNDKNVLQWETEINGMKNLTFYFDQPFYLGELVISHDQNQNVDRYQHPLNALFRRKNCIHTALHGTYVFTTKEKMCFSHQK